MPRIEVTPDGISYIVRIVSDEGIELLVWYSGREELKNLAFVILETIGELA